MTKPHPSWISTVTTSPAQSSTLSPLHVSEAVPWCVRCWTSQMFNMLMLMCFSAQRVVWIWSCSSRPFSSTTQSKWHTVNEQHILNADACSSNPGPFCVKDSSHKVHAKFSCYGNYRCRSRFCSGSQIKTYKRTNSWPMSCEERWSQHSYRTSESTKYCTHITVTSAAVHLSL